jgi:hypothetical protein
MDGGYRKGKRPLVKPRNRWKYTAKMDLKEGCNDIDLIHLAQDTGPSASSCNYNNKPMVSIKGSEFLD